MPGGIFVSSGFLYLFMSFCNRVFGKKVKFTTDLSQGFKTDVEKSINIIGNSPSIENDELLTLLTNNEIEEDDAIEIITFLPNCICSKMAL